MNISSTEKKHFIYKLFQWRLYKIKMASYLHRTAQPSTLATFRSWGSSTGAGRIRLANANVMHFNDY